VHPSDLGQLMAAFRNALKICGVDFVRVRLASSPECDIPQPTLMKDIQAIFDHHEASEFDAKNVRQAPTMLTPCPISCAMSATDSG
jgi:hypothetical protein